MGRCVICYCTDARACSEGCSWLADVADVCSACYLFANVDRRTAIDVLKAFGLIPRSLQVVGHNSMEEAVRRYTEIMEEMHEIGYAVGLVSSGSGHASDAEPLPALPRRNGDRRQAKTQTGARKKAPPVRRRRSQSR